MTNEPELPDARAQAVQRAIDAWVRKLVDFSARNNLLYFRDLKAGTLSFDAAEPGQVERLLAGEAVALPRLAPAETDTDAARISRSMLGIWRRALANHEERGLQTLFLAVGMATWDDSKTNRDGTEARPPLAPVLLYPIAVERAGREGQSFNLRLAGEPQVNLVLLLAIREWSGIQIKGEPLLHGPGEDEVVPAKVFHRLTEAAKGLPGFEVVDRKVLGNFAFQKMALVTDLREHPGVFAGHDLVAAIAGSAYARAGLTSALATAARDNTGLAAATDESPKAGTPSPDANLDTLDPSQEFLVLDADSSQQRVILKALAGQHGVIQGPPGTGKSQSIVNLIASFAAEGKRVLFVAEKRAALEVVLNRLQKLGLGHLALDLHGADVSRKAVMQRVADAFEAVRESVPPPDQVVHRTFVDRRDTLVAHAERMNRPGPGGITLHEVYGELLELPPGLVSETRWRGDVLESLSGDPSRRVQELLAEASTIAPLFARLPGAAWSAFTFPDGRAALSAMDQVQAIRANGVAAADHALRGFSSAIQLPHTDDLTVQRDRIDAAQQWNFIARSYGPELFNADLPTLLTKLAPAIRTGIGGFFGRLGGGYRSARRTLAGMRGSAVPARQLHLEIANAVALRERWRRTGSPVPPDVTATERAAAALAEFDASLRTLSATSREPVAISTDLSDIADWLDALHTQRSDAPRAARAVELRDAIIEAGAGALLAEIEHGLSVPAAWAVRFRHAYLTSMVEHAQTIDSGLAAFDGIYQDQVADEFVDLDKKRLEVAALRVRRAHAERAIAAMNKFPDQEALVRRESQKKTRHLPLRMLVSRAPDVLTALSPCWMASPLSVSQLLDIEKRTFDVVIFDEASQVLPEDAVCSLVRAEYAIVAGDSRQLPPTTFFAAGIDEGELDETDEVGGFESLLDQMMALVPEPWLLEWHYRSRDERLIAFSNREIYGNRLVTFPGARPQSPVRHVLVDSAADENEESSAAEVRRVIELIFEHAEQRPKQSLGVIALGIKHAQRLQDALDREIQARGKLLDFFGETQAEPFFIKNLERVQGDERDAIILSIGYGKDASGNLPFRFGPILQQGGERRLNVAITRARSSMTVVSSFTHIDMDPERCRGRRGLELLRSYLDYAMSQESGLSHGSDGEAPGELERSIAEALQQAGLDVEERLGASDYRVDIAVHDPLNDGAFALAIETDGPTYASGLTARDRDRLRPQQLERLGWRFHRIWSPDWVRQPAAETARILAALRDMQLEAAFAAKQAQPALPEVESPGTDAPGVQGFVAQTEAVIEVVEEEFDDEPRAPGRPERPRVPKRDSIDGYSLRELVALVEWIESDGRLRTDEQLLDAMVFELGFSRRGSRIERAVRQAIAASRPTR